jgi:Xaa-Pro aminopeptidase
MGANSVSNHFAARQGRLRTRLEGRGLSLLVVANPVNLYYLTGFRGSVGVAALGLEEAFLWVDPRYTLQAHEQARGVKVIEARKGLLKAVAAWLRSQGRCRVGYEDTHLTCAQFRELKNEESSSVRFQPAGGMVEELRLLKDQSEIALIREAGRITARVFEELLPQVRPGTRESDLEAEIEYRMRRQGAEGAAFESIVASGPRSALPHARASRKLLGKCELVILDLGAILGGYAADMTRTVYLGRPTARVQRLYSAVLAAQREAWEAIHDGCRASSVDEAARRVLGRRGLAKYFTHSTGHGVGLEVHEKPRLGRGEKTILMTGCVVTVEPGIYLEGFGGIRIEDTVVVGETAAEILTPAPKDSWAIC